MKNILVEIKCNRCFYQRHIKSHTLVLPNLEPNLRKRILSGKMFDYTCPRCSQEISFIHSFLYHDKEHQFLIVMSQEDKNLEELNTQFPDTMIRLVKNPEELKELITIFEDHLQDVQINKVKEKLHEKYPDALKITYRDFDIASNSLWFNFYYPHQVEDIKGIDFHVYEAACKKGV